MITVERRCGIPHGIVFIFDPDIDVIIPEDTGEGPILVTENCISVWTIHEDDGDVSLTLTDQPEKCIGTHIADHVIETKSNELAIHDSNLNPLLEISAGAGFAKISIFANDKIRPDEITCLYTRISP